MAHSYTAAGTGALAQTSTTRRKILVTGAAGNIGAYFAEHAPERYELRLMVHKLDEDAEALKQYGEVVTAELTDLDRLKQLCEGIDTVVHMAGDPSPSAVWQDLLEANIVGTYNMCLAAKAAGCRRLIYASSIHAVSGYPSDVQVKTSEPINPGDLYGVTKCFGEALGRYMAEKEGLSVIALRIGGFQPPENVLKPGDVSMLDAWVSQRDLQQLIERCIDVENLTFAVFHGLSNNRFKRLDISDARELVGYEPQDDFTAEHPDLKELELGKTVSPHNVTGDDEKSGIRKELK